MKFDIAALEAVCFTGDDTDGTTFSSRLCLCLIPHFQKLKEAQCWYLMINEPQDKERELVSLETVKKRSWTCFYIKIVLFYLL